MRGLLALHEGEGQETTREASTTEGCMHTGDLADMDDEGYCIIVGRIKDMVIRGGENVYPREVEESLDGHSMKLNEEMQ